MTRYPIDAALPELMAAVRNNSSVVLHAPPGAGKTTRAPLALLDIVPPEKGRIVMLEPRRIAAVSAARWMARTLGERAGGRVGYTIRFEKMVSAATRLEVVTEGILTRRLQTDPSLEGVAMIIFDEFHERNLQSDLALALCLDIRNGLREDLKILVMSATLDCGPVASLLGNAAVIRSEGKSFPVEERYLPSTGHKPVQVQVTEAVSAALRETPGDILVFLPGSGEIRACAKELQEIADRKVGSFSLHPLYGDLPFEEQEQALLPSLKRKIVLATNIAETSLTIEGVRVVIDSGLTRRLRYDPSTGMNRLVTMNVSGASAEQRKGRAGRLGPGVCYRLYSRQTFQSLVPFTPPEILTSDLSSVVLELALWGVRDASALSWLDMPSSASLDAARLLLQDLGALDERGAATDLGRKMALLPLHPRLAGLLLRAVELGAADLGADLAALLSERDVIRRQSHVHAPDAEADIGERIDLLNAWRRNESSPAADAWALKAVDRTSRQLQRLVAGRPETTGKGNPSSDTVSRLLLRAFPERVAVKRVEDGRFVLSNGRGMRLSGSLRTSSFVVAVKEDAGEKAEGVIHLASPVTEDLIRQECAAGIKRLRRVGWDAKEKRIVAALEERLGAILLSSKPFRPSDEEVLPLLCDAIKSDPAGLITFGKEARQFQGRVDLLRRAFPEEDWPDLSDTALLSKPEEWLGPWLSGVRTAQQLSALDIVPALRALLSWEQRRLLDERTPVVIAVPSGHRVIIDYVSGDIPVLAVKLQEMFGLADTPVVAGGRVKLLLHLLSPARRPVQITQDLKGFWNSGYHQVKKELKGRYPKHPWPDDPWNALPTRRTKQRGSD